MPNTSQETFDVASLEQPLYFPYRAYHHDAGWEKLADLGPELSLSKGYTIRAASNTNYCYLVTSGSMISLVHNPDGQLSQSAFFLRGSLFQEPSALARLPVCLSYKALDPTTLVRIASNDLKCAMMADATVFDFVMESTARKFNATQEQLRETKTLDVRARIYLMLLGLAKDCRTAEDDSWTRINLRLTQQSMSDMLGVNRVTVNTALRDLYDANVVCKIAGRYLVRDTHGFMEAVV